MIYKTIIFIFGISFFGLTAQNEILDSVSVSKLNNKILRLEKQYYKTKTPIYYSIPQATGNYFKIYLKEPTSFIDDLSKYKSFIELKKEYPNLIIDRDLFLIKSVYLDYKKIKKIKIESFEIGKNSAHAINIEYLDSLNTDKVKYYYSKYFDKKTKLFSIHGFVLNSKFESRVLPNKYSNWINYTNVLVQPETKVFYSHKKIKNSFTYNNTIIDSLVQYFNLKSNIPKYNKDNKIEFYQKMELWKTNKKKNVIGLFDNDRKFRKLLKKALKYAKKNKKTNDDLEYYVSVLFSKKELLELLRYDQKMGSCSQDNTPINRLKEIANLAAKTSQWNVFINSFMNLLNDNIASVASNSFTSSMRKTYIEELIKLDLDYKKILLGSNIRFFDNTKPHYYSNGEKTASAFYKLDKNNRMFFEKTLNEIITNDSIDTFNKFHFYNTYKIYQYKFKKSNPKKVKEIQKNLDTLINYLPYELSSRINNTYKELDEFIYPNQSNLDSFEVLSFMNGYMYVDTFGGDCWTLYLKDKKDNIYYSLVMPIDDKVSKLDSFLNKKDDIKSRVKNHFYLQQILKNTPKSRLTISFTKDKSFVDYRNNFTENIPKQLLEKLDFEDAILLSIKFPRKSKIRSRRVYFVLLKNGNLFLYEIPKYFSLYNYTNEQLLSQVKDGFLYYSFKLFDEQGNMIE